MTKATLKLDTDDMLLLSDALEQFITHTFDGDEEIIPDLIRIKQEVLASAIASVIKKPKQLVKA